MARVVRGVPFVLVERDRVGDLDRMRRDGDIHTPAPEPRHELAVEPRDRARLERHREGAGVAVGHRQSVVDEVEVDLESRSPYGIGESSGPRGHIERHMPPVVERRRQGQPDLADDLEPHMQRRNRGLPVAPGSSGHPGPGLRKRPLPKSVVSHGCLRGAACRTKELNRAGASVSNAPPSRSLPDRPP